MTSRRGANTLTKVRRILVGSRSAAAYSSNSGFCKRGENCWFLHKSDRPKDIQGEEEHEPCSICFEKPAIYGLLGKYLRLPISFIDCHCRWMQPHLLYHSRPLPFCELSILLQNLQCIRQWRDPQNKPGDVVDSGNTKKCPMCRASSRFITPSSMYWKDGTEEKRIITQTYMESMARVQCR